VYLKQYWILEVVLKVVTTNIMNILFIKYCVFVFVSSGSNVNGWITRAREEDIFQLETFDVEFFAAYLEDWKERQDELREPIPLSFLSSITSELFYYIHTQRNHTLYEKHLFILLYNFPPIYYHLYWIGSRLNPTKVNVVR
jgi:hypothetical protein